MSALTRRKNIYCELSTKLAALSNMQLENAIKQAEHLYSGIGGKAILLNIDDNKIFVKKIPLTDLERMPENIMSTANLFELSFSYHIGVGSAGFSSWRELFVHIMTTNWVISGDCESFPILYHWRILTCDKPKPMDEKEVEKLEADVKYWDNSPAIRKRLEAMHAASAHIYLFLEYVPQTLDKWLGAKLLEGGEIAANALDFVDIKLKDTNSFMKTQGMIHFDAHFDNILADDNTIYFSDFGLALASQFEMSKEETDLFDTYLTYDKCSTVTNFLHSIIASLLGKDRWSITLQNVANDEIKDFEPSVAKIVKLYAPIALVMDNFYQNMQKVSKATPYPASQLTKLLTDINKSTEREFKIFSATDKESEYIINKIIDFNNTQIAFTQNPEQIYLNFVVKNHTGIIAGINAYMYHWGLLFVDILFVEEDYRRHDFGSKLLQMVEDKAKSMGATIVHLETFDFQAKDFYIKHGYTIFGVLDDCPDGHKSYSLFKKFKKG